MYATRHTPKKSDVSFCSGTSVKFSPRNSYGTSNLRYFGRRYKITFRRKGTGWIAMTRVPFPHSAFSEVSRMDAFSKLRRVYKREVLLQKILDRRNNGRNRPNEAV